MLPMSSSVSASHDSEVKIAPQDLSCNIPLLRQMAAKGDVDAQTRLGINLYHGINVVDSDENIDAGIELLCAAAKSSSPAGLCAAESYTKCDMM